MIKILWLLLVFINIPSYAFSQYSLNINFSKTHINIPLQALPIENILVFKGIITEDSLPNSTPILGKTVKKGDTIQFTPIVPFDWNQKYTLVHRGQIEHYTLPVPEDYVSMSVTNIYPSAPIVPKNILKWYIRFSRPVNTIQLYDHLKFVNASGDTLSSAILPLVNTLISEDETLVTVWITPGRQKRGLIPNKQFGPVFKENAKYTLLVSKNIKDRNGVPIKDGFIHSFRTKNEDRIKPSIDVWNIELPVINTISNLTIYSNESLDYSSKQGIRIMSQNDLEIKGSWQFQQQETILSFTPKTAWQKGMYRIICYPRLEDLAGNNLDRLFDTPTDSISAEEKNSYTLYFTIK